jgi:hypothetical protein
MPSTPSLWLGIRRTEQGRQEYLDLLRTADAIQLRWTTSTATATRFHCAVHANEIIRLFVTPEAQATFEIVVLPST